MINFYFRELSIFISYTFISLCLCIFICVFRLDTLIYFSSFIIINITRKKLFVLYSFDILNISTTLIIFYVLYFISPFIYYVSLTFFNSSWYKIQTLYTKKLFRNVIIISLLNVIFISSSLLVILFMLLLHWNFNNNLTSYKFFDIQLKLYDQIILWILVNNRILFFLNFMYLTITFSFLFWKLHSLYALIKSNKAYFIFILIIFCYFCIDDIYLLVLVLIFTYSITEFSYLFICYKLICIKPIL